jgi:hypothetical protein
MVAKAKAEKKLDLRNVQEQVEDGAKAVTGFGRRLGLIYFGFWGLAYDAGNAWMRSTNKFLDKAERRGLKMEKELNSAIADMRKEAAGEVRKVRESVETRVETVTKEVTSRGEAIEKEVQKAIDKVKPTGLNGKSMKIDQIRIDVEIGRESIFEGYDEMNADEVIEKVRTMDADMLLQTRAYEVARKNRVTVLRAIDEHLEAGAKAVAAETLEPPMMGYDEMTVEEVETVLGGMDEKKLAELRTYEATHKNRVTVLRAVDEEFAARAKAELKA